VKPGSWALAATLGAGPIRLEGGAAVRRLAVRPLGLRPLFNGKDLEGWKRIDHPKLPAERRPLWEVRDGLLRTVGGPGALESQGKHYSDGAIRIEARSLLRHANGGLFFRSQPGLLMMGYEAQLYSRCHDGDVARPWTWATGAIDDRQNARRLVSRDGEFLVMTVAARGPHLATWVNGYQVTSWTDRRERHPNPRQGLRLEPGSIQLQAHDSGTELEFRRVEAAQW
jgi:hypothetical protein